MPQGNGVIRPKMQPSGGIGMNCFGLDQRAMRTLSSGLLTLFCSVGVRSL